MFLCCEIIAKTKLVHEWYIHVKWCNIAFSSGSALLMSCKLNIVVSSSEAVDTILLNITNVIETLTAGIYKKL